MSSHCGFRVVRFDNDDRYRIGTLVAMPIVDARDGYLALYPGSNHFNSAPAGAPSHRTRHRPSCRFPSMSLQSIE